MNPGSLTMRRIVQRTLVWVGLCAVAARTGRGQTSQSLGLPLITPTSIGFDSSGSLYVLETGRHVVDRLDATGALVPVAGSGTQGFAGDGGAATAAELDSPQGIALDGAGNLYVADTHNHRIRLVSAGTGTITTIAGTGAPGYAGDGGPASSALLRLPTALALDEAGNLYVADAGNQRIRKIVLATGMISTVAGNGIQGLAGDGASAGAAAMDTPSGLAVNAAGDLYLADFHNQRVRLVDHGTGMIRSMAVGTAIRLPRGLSMDTAGNVYVAETGGHRVLRIGPDGTVAAMAGTGMEGFAGDNGPATSALLDGPWGTGVSPGGLLTLGDTGNQRIRQVDAGGVIHTLGAAEAADSLTLSAPGVVLYGGGTLTATLSPRTAASGAVLFFEVTNGTNALLGTAGLAQDAASFSTANLPAGTHTMLATYAGDEMHAAASSNPFVLTVNPAPVKAVPVATSVLYGQAIPTLAGSLTGVLARDVSLVSAVFATRAETLSPAGAYPIGALLTGASAGNYQVTVTPANLTILQAPTVTAVMASATPVAAGSALMLSAKVASTIQVIPSGRVTFLDGGAALASGAVDATGGVSVMLSTLAVGSHMLSAVYAGDGNFLASTSPPIAEVVSPNTGVLPDFTVAVVGGATQTAAAGSVVSFEFHISVQNGPLNSPILLTASGMPLGGTATFSPAYLPPSGAVSAFTLTVQTNKTVAEVRDIPVGIGLLMCGIALLPWRRRASARVRLTLIVGGMLAGGLGLEGCGGIQGAELPAKTVATMSYPMMVTATSTLPGGTTLQHVAVVTLVVQ